MGFHGEALLAPRPTPKLEHHLLSPVRDCLFNLFAATLHIGVCSFIRNLRTRHAVVTVTHLSPGLVDLKKIFLSPLRFKLGMMKNYVKTIVHDEKGFQYLQQKYQSINQSVNPKSKKGIFLGPQIKDLLEGQAVRSSAQGNRKSCFGRV